MGKSTKIPTSTENYVNLATLYKVQDLELIYLRRSNGRNRCVQLSQQGGACVRHVRVQQRGQ